jgi:hypothetical protein
VIKTTLIAVAMVAALCWLGPTLDDHSAEFDQAVDLQAAILASIEQGKFDRAAQAVCGPQSPWVQIADGSVQCSTKHGRPTILVRVSP